MNVLYSSKTHEEICDNIKVLSYCIVDGEEALVTVIGYSICLEKGLKENSAMTSSARRVMIAGSQTESGFQNGPGSEARFNVISDICVDKGGDKVIICDQNCVRMMDLKSPYAVVTLCGRADSLNEEFSGIRFKRLTNVCMDIFDNIFLCDSGEARIYKIDRERENIVTFIDNSMVDIFYDGDEDLKKYSVLKSPTTIKTQGDMYLIIYNQGNRSLCKVSLCRVGYEGVRYYSVVKCGLNLNSTFTVDKNRDIIVCENKGGGNLAFHVILSTGEKMHIAKKKGPEISVMQVAIRHDNDSGGLCFFTIETVAGMRKIVRTTIGSEGLKWEKLRAFYMKCLKAPPHIKLTPPKLLEYHWGKVSNESLLELILEL